MDNNRDASMDNSHYLNQQNRIIEIDEADEFGKTDADYNIKTGQTFGESEERTLEKQGWHDA